MTSRSVTVFEVLNYARKEILVGVTDLAMNDLIRGRSGGLPVEVAHWGSTEDIDFRSLSSNMPIADAWHFIGMYVFYIEKGGWRVIRQKPDPRG
jgi:hypothetical protein